jgi:glycosyltransferase involved in cell wall biosynthesis
MRVALLTHEPFFPPSGGGSAEAVYLVQELVGRGHAVEVFCPAVADAAGVAARFGIRLHEFRGWRMGRHTALRNLKYLAYPAALARLVARVAAGTRPDLLVSQHAISAVAAGRLRARLGVPVVMNFLDCLTGFMETWPAWKMPPAAVRALRRYELSLPSRFEADGVLTVSDPLKDFFAEAGYPLTRLKAIYYGYDAALFRPGLAADAETGDGRPVVVMHGSFDEHHLGPLALGALARVARARPEVRWRFVGRRTPALERFLGRVKRAAPGAAVEAPGFVPYAEIPARLADASLGWTPYEPSTGTHCAFVAKTVEYLGLGLPVAGTPLESARRYYADEPAVRLGDATPESLGDVVLGWLALSPAARRALAAPAAARAAAALDWRVVCGHAADFMEATAAGRGAPR